MSSSHLKFDVYPEDVAVWKKEQRKKILRMSSIHLKFDVSPEDVAFWNLTEHPEVEGYVVVSAEGFVTYEKWNLIKNPNSVTGWKVKNEDFRMYRIKYLC
ncbi:unnamed protein product [Caenorhabditis brenneri]